MKDPAVAAGNYSALYTNVVLDALDGARPDVLETGRHARRCVPLCPAGRSSGVPDE